MAKTPLLLIGGGGHCASVIDVIESTGQYDIVGIIEAEGSENTAQLGYKVIGTDSQLAQWIEKVPDCVITVGQLENVFVRKTLSQKVKKAGGRLPVIISAFAHVARTAKIGEGSVVMHHALVNSEARIGNNCIINSKALVEHGALIEDFCHISTGALINGEAEVENECFIGSGSVVFHGIKICAHTVVGAGSVVTRDLLRSGIYVGNPAKLKGSGS